MGTVWAQMHFAHLPMHQPPDFRADSGKATSLAYGDQVNEPLNKSSPIGPNRSAKPVGFRRKKSMSVAR